LIMLDLFTGIGGFSLAASWVWGDELEIVAFCEMDKFCQKILNKHWPDVPIIEDIRSLDGTKYKGTIDLITGGFPCQDISIAGKGVGIDGNRSGLWSEMWRIISEIRPKFVIVENVSAITFRGLEQVLRDLAEIGYNAEWQCISANRVRAWHKRERFWLIAYPNMCRCKRRENSNKRLSRLETLVYDEWNKNTPRTIGMAYGIQDKLDEDYMRLKALGNAIVPQVAYMIMKSIKEVR